MRKTETYMSIQYDFIEEILPKDIFFITTQELEDLYPDKTPKEREYIITKEKGAVCPVSYTHLDVYKRQVHTGKRCRRSASGL